MNSYEELLYLPHYEPSIKHQRMSIYNRSAQFAPFAALSGFNEEIDEVERRTDAQIVIMEDEIDLLNEKLKYININDLVKVTYFVKDERKQGGKYINKNGYLKKIDSIDRIVKLDNQIIYIDNIINIEKL